MQLSKLTDTELMQEYRELDNMIYVVECYGTGDMRRLFAVEELLRERGYDIELLDNNKWQFTKEDENAIR